MSKGDREPNTYIEGQFYERGAWCETLVQVPGIARQLARHFGDIEKKHHVIFNKLNCETLLGDDARAPKPRAAKYFVVVYATVRAVDDDPRVMDVSWVHGLRPGDHSRMRQATRRALHPKRLTDYDCDLVIGMLGPQVARKMLEKKLYGVDGIVLRAANDVRLGE